MLSAGDDDDDDDDVATDVYVGSRTVAFHQSATLGRDRRTTKRLLTRDSTYAGRQTESWHGARRQCPRRQRSRSDISYKRNF